MLHLNVIKLNGGISFRNDINVYYLEHPIYGYSGEKMVLLKNIT